MKKLFEKLGHGGLVLWASLLLALFFYMLFTYFWPVGELVFYDLRLRALRSSEPDPDIQVIAIDQASLDEFGAFPWSRTKYSELIDSLKSKPPGMLIFDILFEESKPEDEELAEAIKDAGFPVLLPYRFSDPDAIKTRRMIPTVELLNEASGVSGFINTAMPDADGRFRYALLAIENEGIYYPSLDLSAYAILKGIEINDIQYGNSSITVGDTVIPTTDDYRILIQYPHTAGRNAQPMRSFYHFIENPEKTYDNPDRISILGIGTYGMSDDFPTPFEDKTFGAVIHANIIDTLIKKQFINRVPNWMNFTVLIMISLLFGLLISRFHNVKQIGFISFAILAGFTLLNFILFKAGYWIDYLSPFFSIFSSMLVVSSVQFFRTHKLFQQFVAPEIVNQMVSSDEYSKLGGVEKEVSILFSDIRGYTSLSEKMTPSQVMEMLNEYHTEMVCIFEKNFGRVFDYMGDAQMVVFGAPRECKDHAYWACKAALEMNDALTRLCEKWQVEDRTSFEVGIGICTGTVAIGLVGAEGHKQYSAIGDSTNVASRLQGQSKVLGATIIVSPVTLEKVKDRFEYRSLGTVELKGKSEQTEVFTIIKEKD